MSVGFTNLDRVLWPETGFTKGDMIEYYRAVAPALLPHLAHRPLTLWRFPEGVHRPGFWQNECRGAPEWMQTAEIRGQRFCVVNELDSLLWIANLGTVELHPFLFRVDAPERPTALVLDLDPGKPAGLLDAAEVALRLRETLGVPSFPKTSGGYGLHVFAPAGDAATFAETKAAARSLAEARAAEQPGRVIVTARRADRRGKVLVDWLQNDPTRSTVAPYSLRGRPRPTVSTPVTWEEVERAVETRDLELLTFGPADVLDRLARLGDIHAETR